MTISGDMNKTLREVATEVAKTNKEVRDILAYNDAIAGTAYTFGSADGTVRDVLSIYAAKTKAANTKIKDHGYGSLWSILANTICLGGSAETKNAFIPVVATAMAIKTEKKHARNKDMDMTMLAQIMDITHKARVAGWLNEDSLVAVNRLIGVSAERFGVQSRAEERARRVAKGLSTDLSF